MNGTPIRAAVAALLLGAVATLAGTPGWAAENVEVESADGFVLRATYYAGAPQGPAILLLHQCNLDRTAWGPLAGRLSAAGFHVMALDFRGFGDSVGGEVREFHDQRDELWPTFPADVDAALDALLRRPGVRKDAIGLVGASCGGSQELLLARRQPRVASLVFLSTSLPWIDETTRTEYLRDADPPILAIASEDDRGSADTARALFEGSRNGQSRLVLYKGRDHGVPLFDRDPDLQSTIVDWFERTLPAPAASR